MVKVRDQPGGILGVSMIFVTSLTGYGKGAESHNSRILVNEGALGRTDTSTNFQKAPNNTLLKPDACANVTVLEDMVEVRKTCVITFSGIVSSELVQDTSDIKASVISPSGARKAILRETSESKQRRFVEIWAGDRLEIAKEVTDTHGVFCTEGQSVFISHQ